MQRRLRCIVKASIIDYVSLECDKIWVPFKLFPCSLENSYFDRILFGAKKKKKNGKYISLSLNSKIIRNTK